MADLPVLKSEEVQLSIGGCELLSTIGPENDDALQQTYVFQVLSTKQMNTQPGSTDRYRIIFSDSKTFLQGMLATQLNSLVTSNQLVKNAIVQIDKMSSNTVQGRNVIIIMGVTVIGLVDSRIGVPGQPSGATPAAATPTTAPSAAAASSVPSNNAASSSSRVSQPARNPKAASVFPIEALSPYQNNWTIKARVTQKGDIRTYSTQRGDGKLFNVTLMDETGEIRGTAFNAVVDELEPKIQEGKVYYISKARVNLAKKKFSNLKNDYELSFEKNTEFEECTDVTDVPQVKYDFTPLSQLGDKPKDSIIDVVGVIKEAGEATSITTKSSNKTLTKRELTIVDSSNFSVRLTLWGKQAEDYNHFDQPVIAFKGVKVGDFQGRSLSMAGTSTMAVNPEIPEAYELQGWFEAEGSKGNFQSQTSGGGSYSGGFNRSEVKSLLQVKESNLGMQDKPDYFSCKATIMHIKADGTLMYPACQSADCNKKVVQGSDDQWGCEKCNKKWPAPQYRYILSMAVADYSGQAWFQGFNDVGETVFGMTADELHNLKEQDESQATDTINKAAQQTFNFNCRAKADEYNDQVRVRYGISRIYPLNKRDECVAMLEALNSSWGRD